MYKFYEFFAGGGMARAGLGDTWECLFANDLDTMKAEAYAANWSNEHLVIKDVAKLTTDYLRGRADLAWASFPCQDLSLAGAGAGIRGEHSGTFWPFWDLMRGLIKEGRGPKLIVLENVYGTLRSHGGEDFAAIGSAFSGSNYRFGAMIIDAVDFLPQSRPRLFIVGVHPDIEIPQGLQLASPSSKWHPKAVVDAYDKLSKAAAKKWVWWNLHMPEDRAIEKFVDIIEEDPQNVAWHDSATTARLLSMMTEKNKLKVENAKSSGCRMVGGVYRRTRNGVQRAEVRFDVSGCLRTPAGGSSRQTILVVEGQKVRSRLLSPREAARLMGLPDWYELPSNYNDAYHLAGDGVAVPVVEHLAKHLLEVILKSNAKASRTAA